MVSLVTACLASFLLLLLLCVLSSFSGGASKGGAYGRTQIALVCTAAARRASFYAKASRQDESAALALLHACEARAHALAAKELAERCNVDPDRDLLELLDDAQERIDALLRELHDDDAGAAAA
jgi:hypothetical protein